MSTQAARVPLNEYEFPASKLANVQAQLERLVSKNYYLHQVRLSPSLARSAFGRPAGPQPAACLWTFRTQTSSLLCPGPFV